MSSRFLAVLAALALPAIASAVPQAFTHQGRIADSAGAGLTGSHDLTFSFYADAAGTDVLWSETQTLTFDNGYFAADIGSTKDLDTSLFDGQEIWLGLTVDSGTELPQRIVLNSVPYALHAGTATAVSGGVVDASELKINGTTVIGPDGSLSTPASWSTLEGIPSDFADDTDNDTLSGLTGCATGTVATFDGSDWVCSPLDLSTLSADNLTEGTVAMARLPVGDGEDQVAAGNHTHADYAALSHTHDYLSTDGGTLTGGLQIGSSNADCDEDAAGTLRFTGTDLEVCLGGQWSAFRTATATDGSSADRAAKTCKDLLAEDSGAKSGVTWVDPDGSGGRDPFQVYCDMGTAGGGWMVFARVFEENDAYKYGFDEVNNGFATDKDTFVSIEGVSFEEMMFARRDSGESYTVDIGNTVTWPTWGDPFNAGNGYTIASNPDAPGQVIRAYDADGGKHFQLCFLDSHNDECGPTSAGDTNNFGDAGGNDDQNMLWEGNEVHAIGTGIVWDFAIR